MTTGGLLRFPRFYRQLLGAVSIEMDTRGEDELPQILSPEANVRDVAMSLLFAVGFFFLRVALNRVIMDRGRRRFTVRVRGKLSENLYYTLYYTAAFAYFVLVLRPSVDWKVDMFSNRNDIVPEVMDPYPPPMNRWEHLYYAQAFGFYVSALVFLLGFDSRRSDYHELMIHHLVTLGLFVFSYLVGYVRVGMAVISLHDIGDILLYGAKFVHYLGYAGFDTAVFACFAVTFYVTRLVMYTRMVFAIAVETLATVAVRPALCGWGKFFETYFFHHMFFAAFLGTLQVLHCFWFALILKMIYRELFLGKKVSDQGDIRSDDESDGEEEDEPQLSVKKVD